MPKVDRRIREMNNRNREFWGDAPLPKPEAGFVEEALPPLFEWVSDVFSEVTAGQPHRKRPPKVPDAVQIKRIARLLQDWLSLPRRGALEEVAAAKCTRLARAAAEFGAALDEVLALAIALPGGRDDPAIMRLAKLQDDLRGAPIPPARRQGEKSRAWPVMARALESRVRDALSDVGHTRASLKADGPLVRIVAQLLGLIGDPPSEDAVAHVLKRRRAAKGGPGKTDFLARANDE
jgi:hypothetical protein